MKKVNKDIHTCNTPILSYTVYAIDLDVCTAQRKFAKATFSHKKTDKRNPVCHGIAGGKRVQLLSQKSRWIEMPYWWVKTDIVLD